MKPTYLLDSLQGIHIVLLTVDYGLQNAATKHLAMKTYKVLLHIRKAVQANQQSFSFWVFYIMIITNQIVYCYKQGTG